MIRLFPLTLAMAAVAVAACAPVPGDAVDQRAAQGCFLPERVVNFRSGSSPSLYVKAYGGDVFELQTTSFCPGAESTNTLVLTPLMGGGGRVCVSDMLTVDVEGMGGGNRCTARVVRKLTAEDLAALPSRYRP